MKLHIAYCWELGRGFGHVSRINQIVNDSSLTDCQFSFVVREVNKAHLIEKCQTDNLYQAPFVDTQLKGFSANFSHLLMRCGWESISSATSLLAAWRNLFCKIKPDLVLLDHSPSAGLAAISLGIPIRQIGNGFEIPPCETPMPSMQLHLKNDKPAREESDAHLRTVFDALIRDISMGDRRFSLDNLFKPEYCLIAGNPVLDHYGQRSDRWKYLALETKPATPLQDLSSLNENNKPVLFFYLDARTPQLVALFKLLATEFSLFGHLNSGADPALLSELRKTGALLFEDLLNIEQAFRSADFVVSNAGVGLLNNALQYSTPTLLIPMQLEQSMVAFQLHQRRLAWAVNPQNIVDQVQPHLRQWIGARQVISDNISQAVEVADKRYWQGNLMDDFLALD